MNDVTMRVDAQRVYHAEEDMIGKTFQVNVSDVEVDKKTSSQSGVDMKTMQEILEKSKGRYGYRFIKRSFDVVFSSLAIHYLTDFPAFVEKVRGWLKPGGDFVFSVEHPIFTAYGNQDWYYDEQGNILHFPVDNYFYEGQRQAVFLGEDVVKYHRTLTTYLDTLLTGGFALRRVVEAKPPERMLDIPGMKDELRRPMMLLVAAVKL